MKQILYAREFQIYINKINIDFVYEICGYIYIYKIYNSYGKKLTVKESRKRKK